MRHPIRMYLPLVHPSDTPNTNVGYYWPRFCQSLSVQQGFSAVTTSTQYVNRFPSGTPAETRISAIWAGSCSLDSRNIVLQLNLGLRLDLKDELGADFPIPYQVIYGPIRRISDDGSPIQVLGNVKGGTTLGWLDGNVLEISLLDQYGFYLDPEPVFALFRQRGLWALSDSQAAQNPFGKQPTPQSPIRIAGPTRAESGKPYIVISGGSLGGNLEIHNPPNPLPSRYFSFISSDGIILKVQREGVSTQESATIQIEDVSDPMYKTKDSPPTMDFHLPINDASGTVLLVSIQETLRPSHLGYLQGQTTESVSSGNGKRSPGKPLTYRLKLQSASLGTRSVSTTITQDTRDIIRQEYLFHSSPFQNPPCHNDDSADDLEVPERQRLKRDTPPSPGGNFTAEAVYEKKNYWSYVNDAGHTEHWVYNLEETYQLAEYVLSQYAQIIDARRAATPDSVPKEISKRLGVNSGWRNPERNEAVGGVRTSNHQFGRALDLCPQNGTASQNRKILVYGILYEAAKAFLAEMGRRNSAAACAKIQILVEHNAKSLWEVKLNVNGDVIETKGSGYDGTGEAPATLAGAFKVASHIHIGWKSATNTALSLPPIPPKPAPQLPSRNLNLILIGAFVEGYPKDKEPFLQVAESLRELLQRKDPDTEVQLLAIKDPLQYLEYCNSFRASYKIRNLFSLSHGWPAGLQLEKWGGHTIATLL